MAGLISEVRYAFLTLSSVWQKGQYWRRYNEAVVAQWRLNLTLKCGVT